jgi:hypothetical protein
MASQPPGFPKFYFLTKAVWPTINYTRLANTSTEPRFAGGNHESPLLGEAEHLAVGELVQGLRKSEGGEDEGILVSAWSVAAFGGRIGARQSGQQCDASVWMVERGNLSLLTNTGV